MKLNKNIKHSIILYAIGIVFMPVGVILTVNSKLGAGGYDAFNFVLAKNTELPISLIIWLTAGTVMIITAFVRKKNPRITTFFSAFILGIFTNLWNLILKFIHTNLLFLNALLLLSGILIISFAVACYMISGFSPNPLDDFVLALHEKGIRLRWAKVSLDCVFVILAIILHGSIGVGTIICTFSIGYLVDVFYNKIECHAVQ